ncbi:MAG: hypothetical protein WEG56_03670 [Chloroflexota bacterium]
MRVDELAETELLGQGGRQEQSRIGDETVVVEGGFQPVEAVLRSHPSGAPLAGLDGLFATPSFTFQMGT